MRLIKLVASTSLLMVVCLAVLGVANASAETALEEVVVCSKKIDPCLEGVVSQALPSGTLIDASPVSGEKSVILTSVGNVECIASFSGATTSTLARGKISSLTFTNCNLGENMCIVFTPEEVLPLFVRVLLSANDFEYHAVVSGGGTGLPTIHVECPLMNCVLSASEVLYEVLLIANVNHTVWDVLQTLNREGGLCPSTSVWHTKYLVRCLLPTGTFVNCWPKME
jgi:hypothetical protein